MQWFLGPDPTGDPFTTLNSGHQIALSVLVLVNIAAPLILRRAGEGPRKAFRYTLAALMALNEIMLHGWLIATGRWTPQEMLPFHLCGMIVWLCVYTLVRGIPHQWVYEVLFLAGIGGAIQGVMTPLVPPFNFPHFRAITAMISHGGIITTALYFTRIEGWRPYWRSIPHVLLVLIGYAIVIFPLNLLLGSNYLFINRKPPIDSLLSILPDWPLYLPILLVLAALVFVILYLPFAVRDGIKR